jgi:heme exporter protein D
MNHQQLSSFAILDVLITVIPMLIIIAKGILLRKKISFKVQKRRAEIVGGTY